MPRIEEETTYRVGLTDAEQDSIENGEEVVVELPSGDTIRLTGADSDSSEASDTSTDVDASGEATPEKIEQLVQDNQTNAPEPEEGEGGNPHAGGIIDVDRSG